MDQASTETTEITKSPASLTPSEMIGALVRDYFQREKVDEFLKLEGSRVSYEDLLELINSNPFLKRFGQKLTDLTKSWWFKEKTATLTEILAKLAPDTILDLKTDLAEFSKDYQGSFENSSPELVGKFRQNLPCLEKYFETRRIVG